MPDHTLNEKIAARRGYCPPGSPEVEAARRVAGLGHSTYDNYWLHPNGTSLCPMPRFTGSPGLMAQLLADCRHVRTTRMDDGWFVHLELTNGTQGKSATWGSPLKTAVAEAWWKAKEAERDE